jgi:poly(A) polymerase
MTTGVDTDLTKMPEPLIIPRPEHPVSRKDIDREALKVMYRLRDAGFTSYLVGGGVRDLYLGKTPKDFDISTNAKPGQLRKLFKNSRIIGKRFRLVQVFYPGNKIVEVSTLRCRSEFDLNGSTEVLPSNNTFGTPVEDAFRRDLTINGLFYEIENHTIIDYVKGVEDLKNGVVRMIGDPDRRINRDPVRMLRAIRHAARSGFTIEKNTWDAIKTHRDKLLLCPVSRIRDELLKDLQGGASRKWADIAIHCGLFFVLFPFYKETMGDKDPKYHDQVLAVFSVIDRIHSNNQKLPDHMLFALLMTPWAEKALDLMALRTGAERHIFSRSLRKIIDEKLGHMNLKRASRDEVAKLLSYLPVFYAYEQKGSWPKSVKNKSYFKNCLLFYQMHVEASGGQEVTGITINPEPPRQKRTRKPSRHSSRTPVYAKSTKGGIFGFKR